jgi:hypothetical protein
MFAEFGKRNLRSLLWLGLGTGLGIAAASYSWLVLYSVVGFIIGLITLRAVLLQLLGPSRNPNYQQPDYRQAESTLIGRFPGNGRAMRRPNKAC